MLNIYQQIKNAIADILQKFKDFVIRLNPEKLHGNLDAIDGASQNIHINTTSIDKNLSQMLENNSSYQKDILTAIGSGDSVLGSISNIIADIDRIAMDTLTAVNYSAGVQVDIKNSLQSINDTLILISERLPE